MNKDQYLEDVYVKDFIDYIYKIVSGCVRLNYSYTISMPQWKKWARENHCVNSDYRITYENWDDLLKKYYWAGGNYRENEKIISEIVDKFKHGISKGNDRVFVDSIRVLEWGQTYKGSIAWLLSRYDDGTLSDCLKDAVTILDGDNWGEPEKKRFKKDGDLLMDSGLTKIYSLASNRSIIYDGRVAAALAYLVVQFLGQHRTGIQTIPDNLNFAVDKEKKDVQKRVMRSVNYNQSIFRNKKNNKLDQAESNIWANWIIRSIVDRAKIEDKGVEIFSEGISRENYSQCMRKIEAALFMMGSRIDGF